MSAAVNAPVQAAAAGTPLSFAANTAQYGTAVTHTAGSSDIVINEPGIYQVSVGTTAAAATGTAVPVTGQIRLQENGTDVAGATALHTFTAVDESANLAFTVPVVISTTPATLTVVPQQAGINYSDTSISVQKIGVETAP